jgi:hypothetical protein
VGDLDAAPGVGDARVIACSRPNPGPETVRPVAAGCGSSSQASPAGRARPPLRLQLALEVDLAGHDLLRKAWNRLPSSGLLEAALGVDTEKVSRTRASEFENASADTMSAPKKLRLPAMRENSRPWSLPPRELPAVPVAGEARGAARPARVDEREMGDRLDGAVSWR